MNALYWFALVVGAGMFLFSVAADFLGDADVDAGTGVDVDHDAGGDTDAHGFRILSLRNATYFLFAFGVTGVVLSWLWGGARAMLVATLATALGVVGGAISSTAFGWVKRTESGELLDDRGWIGTSGRVTLPLSASSTGKIEVERGGREHELLARPFDNEADRPERWTQVMVIEMQHGVALVAPQDALLESPEAPRIAPKSEK